MITVITLEVGQSSLFITCQYIHGLSEQSLLVCIVHCVVECIQ